MRKDAAAVEACGAVDEAQAALGAARALAGPGTELDGILVGLERGLWVLMAELATAAEHRNRLVAGSTLVTPAMVARLESAIDEISGRFPAPTGFVVPGQSPLAAQLDVARTVIRRAERRALAVATDGSSVLPYLNRLSDLVWTLARWQEDVPLPARPARPEERP